MKKPLQVGDRVRVYVADCMLERDQPEMQMRNMEVTWTGVIKALNSEGRAAYVIDDNGARMCWVHVRQCIRLIPPKARRVWVPVERYKLLGPEGTYQQVSSDIAWSKPQDEPDSAWIEFVEVKRKGGGG